MSDISLEENKAINTQQAMNHIPLNSDILGVIKSFLFYDKALYAKHTEQKIEQKMRKDGIIRLINSQEENQRQPYVGVYYCSEINEQELWHWCIWLPIPANGWNCFQLQSSSCFTCGKYVYVSTLEVENAIMNNKYIMCVNGQH